MKRTSVGVALAALLASAWVATGASVAQAQLIAGPGMSNPAMSSKGRAAKPAEPPPPALPGAQTDNERVAPPEKPVADMPPTEALFDAINRGDIASARDAISRGADLNGHNLLGMTPMELSVDLGRNNISFLLLSLRGGESRSRSVAKAPETAAPGKRPPQVAQGPHAPGAGPGAHGRVTPAAVRESREARRPPARTESLFAGGDGGAPIPSAGFLGFDPTRGGSTR